MELAFTLTFYSKIFGNFIPFLILKDSANVSLKLRQNHHLEKYHLAKIVSADFPEQISIGRFAENDSKDIFVSM